MAAVLCLCAALARGQIPVQTWVQRCNGPTNRADWMTSIAVDGNNNVIVTAPSYGGGSGDDYATIKYSSTGVALWTNRYNGPGNRDDYPWGIAVDRSNAVIVTGSSWSGFGWDYATIEYSSTGIPLWTNRDSGPANNNGAWAITVDSSNNVIVTGYSRGNGTGYDYGTIKYSSAGVPLWVGRYNGPANGDDLGYAVAVDSSNNVVVTGYSQGFAGDYDFATVKYSSAGIVQWVTRYDGPANWDDYATALAVDGNNNVIVTGASPGIGSTNDYATIKYSSAGVPLWTNRYNGSGVGDDEPWSVAVDSSNNVYVTGYSWSRSNGFDYATIKYSSAGVPLWTNRYNGPGNGDDYGYALGVDGGDNIIVVGQSWTSVTGKDYTTIKYSSAGVPLWTNRYNGPQNGSDGGWAVKVDRSDNVLVTGYSRGSASYSDFATVKYAAIPAPVLTALRLTNGGFQLRVDGVLQPGTLVIQASTNLAVWVPVFTNTTPTNLVFYTDPGAGNGGSRFFRAFQSP